MKIPWFRKKVEDLRRVAHVIQEKYANRRNIQVIEKISLLSTFNIILI